MAEKYLLNAAGQPIDARGNPIHAAAPTPPPVSAVETVAELKARQELEAMTKSTVPKPLTKVEQLNELKAAKEMAALEKGPGLMGRIWSTKLGKVGVIASAIGLATTLNIPGTGWIKDMLGGRTETISSNAQVSGETAAAQNTIIHSNGDQRDLTIGADGKITAAQDKLGTYTNRFVEARQAIQELATEHKLNAAQTTCLVGAFDKAVDKTLRIAPLSQGPTKLDQFTSNFETIGKQELGACKTAKIPDSIVEGVEKIFFAQNGGFVEQLRAPAPKP